MALSLSDSAQIFLGYQDKRAKVKARNLTAQIGDPLEQNFKPELKLSMWDGECYVKINLNGKGTPTKLSEAAVNLLTRNEQSRAVIAASDISHDIYVKDNGDLEWDIILPSKPTSNEFVFDIDTKELDWFYQPPELTQEDINQGALERPDNVKGSYAVYHKTKRDNVKRLDGSEEIYETGKAFHLYRPEAYDANGKKTWCELQVDEALGELVLTVPQKFLNTAKYPVTIDPDFGYTTAGGSSASILDAAAHLLSTHTTGSSPSEEITEFHSYCSRDAAAGTYETAMAVYDVSSSLPNNRTHTETSMGDPTSTAGWQNVTGLSLALSASTEYCAACGEASGSDPCYFWYDTGSSGDQSVNTGMLTSSWSERFSSSWKRSFYATAEEVAGGTTVTPDPINAGTTIVDPTVVKGSLTMTPGVISAGAAIVDPTVVKGSLIISPGPISAGTTIVDPTIDIGSVIISPGPISAGAAIVDPTIVKGSIVISPDPISAGTTIVDPTAVRGSLTIVPDPISAGTTIVDPTVIEGGDITISPTPIAAGTVIVDPTVLKGSVTIAPTAIAAGTVIVDPTVLLTAGSIINVWARVNGVNVANSNTTRVVSDLTSLTFTHVIELQVGDYYELMFAVNDLSIILDAQTAAGVAPATPSVIIDVEKIR